MAPKYRFIRVKDKESYGSDTSHAEKSVFDFSRTRKATAAIHRTQKKCFSFSRTEEL
ncbi:hypothetical protein [Virgibacillus proomii]|uniref:hypothetical protein n=1 Tax=Virgibacillus proomii TaxID=84407 RepID=UPI001C0FF80C|nr:hypothetical protein [Virgibacillus proomii]MBU5265902.1 hypothetical protein [Virgibacillus proomii]